MFGDFICKSLIKSGKLPEGYRYMSNSEYCDTNKGYLERVHSRRNEDYKVSFILDSTFEIITISIPVDLYKTLQRHYKLINLLPQ